MGFEEFSALPIGAQLGIVGFILALVLLAIAQALSVASSRAKAQTALLNDLVREVRRLSDVGPGTGTMAGRRGDPRRADGGPRPLKSAPVQKRSASYHAPGSKRLGRPLS